MIGEYKTLYPAYMWVAFGSDLSEIRDRFVRYNNMTDFDNTSNSKVFDQDDILDDCDASVFAVMETCTGRKGFMMILPDDIDLTNTKDLCILTHESVHVADGIFEYIGAYSQEFSATNEPYTYLVEWAMENAITYIKNENSRS